MSSVPSPPVHRPTLSEADESRLTDAHARLRMAVGAYEPHVAATPLAGDLAADSAEDLRRAQAEVESAERDLWVLREELLGWKRPSWAPNATSTADWFSPEDAVYDDPSYDTSAS